MKFIYHISLLLSLVLSGTFSYCQIDTVSNSPNYKLLEAASNGSLQDVRIALLEGADVNAKTDEGVTALMYACANGDLEIVQTLLENNADPNLVPFYSSRTALIAAVNNGYLLVAEELIRHHAAINYKDYTERTALHYAALADYFEILDMLLYYGARPEMRDNEGTTPLMIAAFYCDTAMIHRLLQEETGSSSKGNYEGNTPLMMAAQNNCKNSIRILLEESVMLNIRNEKGFTALDIALMHGNDSIANILLQQDSLQINDSIHNGYNSLSLARKSCNKETVKKMKTLGAKDNPAPYFNSVVCNMEFNWNFDDILWGGNFGIHEEKYNLDILLGINTRIEKKRVLAPQEQNTYYQVYENRHLAYLGIMKYWTFSKSLSGLRWQFNTGAKQAYTWAKYTGYNESPFQGFRTIPQAGISLQYDLFKFSVNYEYYNYDSIVVSPHRINIGLNFYIRFRNDMFYHILL